MLAQKDDNIHNFDSGIDPILRTTGLKPVTLASGRTAFAHPTQNGNFMLIENIGRPDASPADAVWIGARTDAQGRGFRMDRPQTLHKAIVSSCKLKDPTYSRGLEDDFEVAEAFVSDEKECGAILERLLTQEPDRSFAPR